MLRRQAVRAGLRAWTGTSLIRISCAAAARSFASDVPTGDALPDDFKKAWASVAPNLDLPRFPVSYMKSRPQLQTSIPTKLTVNLVLPHKFEIQAKEVDMVIVPATTGQLGVLPSHVPTIAELKPGLLSIHEGDDIQKYFVSSGFAFVHQNSVCDVVVIESVPIDQLDAEEIRKGLVEYTDKFNSASTDLEKAEAQIGIEVHSALSTALTG